MFCPTANVLRQEMAVFLIKAANQLPAACAGLFNDVPCDSIYAPYIEKLSNLGVTAGARAIRDSARPCTARRPTSCARRWRCS